MANISDIEETANLLSYALAKQIPSMTALETDYGSFKLTRSMRQAVEKALCPILERRLAELHADIDKERAGTVPCSQCKGRGGFTNPLWEAYHSQPPGRASEWVAEQGYASLAAFSETAGPFSTPCAACNGTGRHRS